MCPKEEQSVDSVVNTAINIVPQLNSEKKEIKINRTGFLSGSFAPLIKMPVIFIVWKVIGSSVKITLFQHTYLSSVKGVNPRVETPVRSEADSELW